MYRLAQIVTVSRSVVRVSAVVVLGGLAGITALAGCDLGSPYNGPEDTSNEAKLACVGGPKFDPAGVKNVGNGHGGQFIGGQCRNAKDCASGCCAFPCGICSGPGAQFQNGKKGCGFGDRKAPVAQPGAKPAPAPDAGAKPAGGGNGKACVGGPKFDPAGDKNVGNGHGGQFIGGQCLSAKDCASGCCALPCGICSGPGAQFQNGKQGCGFGGKGK